MNKYQNMTPQEILSEAKTLAQESTILAEKTKIKALSIESINKSENAVLNQVFELIALAHSVQDDLKIRVTFSTGIKAVYLSAEFNDSEEQLDCGFVSLDEPKVLEELLKSEDKLLSLVAEAKDKKRRDRMCLNFVAVTMNSGGGVVRDKETGEMMVKQIGEFESRDDAIKSACEILDCTHILNGVLARGNHTGGFLLCDSQE